MTQIDYSAFDTPGRGRGVLDVIRYRYLLRLLIGKSTSLRYRNSVLGWFWSYVRPTVQFLVYYLVVGQILGLHKSVPYFPLYLFSGLVLVNLFNETLAAATGSIVSNKALVRKIYLPRELFPLAAIIGAFTHFLPQLAVLIVASLIFGWLPSLASVGLVLAGVLIVLGFVIGLGLFFSAVNVRFRDASNVVEIIRTIATWSVPILYTWAMVYERSQSIPWLFHIYMSNPLAVAVELFHHAFWGSLPSVAALDPAPANLGWPPLFGWYVLAAIAVILFSLVVGQLVFRRFERTFAQDL
ncbi:ABC transporter permease [Microbacterium sp. LjRoot45]|uniref:Transport permease protein n=1 Tax=Candidatus Microbacterium phytovorans TaxID=3121374 RepID=A0AAJ6B408_9MICO|nr:ABC transporter permease [Microbacterium sp.]WEK13792.1 MAG: ABC transporter permease [Microbacterium sp.]